MIKLFYRCLNKIPNQLFTLHIYVGKQLKHIKLLLFNTLRDINYLTSYISQKLIRTKNATRGTLHVVQYSSRIVLNYYTAKIQGRVLLTSVVWSPENVYHIVCVCVVVFVNHGVICSMNLRRCFISTMFLYGITTTIIIIIMFPCSMVYERAVLEPFRQHVFRFHQKAEKAYCRITRYPFLIKML